MKEDPDYLKRIVTQKGLLAVKDSRNLWRKDYKEKAELSKENALGRSLYY